MKVLHTPARFHPFTGGVENHVRDLGKELVDLGVDLGMRSKSVLRAEELEYLQEYENLGVL